MVKLSLIILVGLSLMSCTSQLSRNQSFGANSPTGLAVIGLYPSNTGYKIALGTFDPDTNVRHNRFAAAASFENYSTFGPSKEKYVAAELAAGHYFITQVSVLDYQLKRVHTAGPNAVTFEIKPGQVNYIGDFSVSELGSLTHEGYVESKAQELISSYPNIKGELVTREVSYKNILPQ